MITIDASAIIKLVVDENNSDIATKLFYDVTKIGEPILAPDIILPEAMNGLWKNLILLKNINDKQFDIAVGSLIEIWNNLVVIQTDTVLKEAVKLSREQKITFYDALYVAISISKDAPIFTFDQPVLDKCANIGLKAYNSI
jgi:predicted nucleic acid-binding protein